MRNLILLLGFTILASMGRSVEAQVTCSPDVPQNICKSADVFFQTTTQHDPVRIEILTPSDFQKRRDQIAGESTRVDEKCSCFNFLHQRLMSNTFDPDEIMLLRDKPGSAHVSEVLISFEAFYGLDSSKATTSGGVIRVAHNGVLDPSGMQAIAAYIEGYTDALRYTP